MNESISSNVFFNGVFVEVSNKLKSHFLINLFFKSNMRNYSHLFFYVLI